MITLSKPTHALSLPHILNNFSLQTISFLSFFPSTAHTSISINPSTPTSIVRFQIIFHEFTSNLLEMFLYYVQFHILSLPFIAIHFSFVLIIHEFCLFSSSFLYQSYHVFNTVSLSKHVLI